MQPSRTRRPADTLLTTALRAGATPIMVAAGFSLVTNLLYLALPIFTNQVYGRVLTSESVPTLIVLATGTIFVFAVSGVIDVYRTRVMSDFGVVLDRRVSSHVFSALFDGVTRREPAAGAQALRDLDLFRQTITGAGLSVLFDLPWAPIYMAVLFFIDPLIGLVTLFGAAVLCVLALIQARMSRPPLKAANDAALRSYGFTEAGLRNSEVVRAMGMLPDIGLRWSRDRAECLSQGSLAGRHAEVWGSAIRFVRMLVQILIIAIGAWLIIRGDIGVAMLFANMILSSRALAPIERGVASWSSLVSAGQAFERLNILLADYSPVGPQTALPRPKGQLSVEGVNFAAPGGERMLLTALSFQLPAGQFLGVIGPSGAGKSTLARLLVGVWKPLSGAIRLDGADVFSWPREDFGRHIGYLPQDTELFSGTVRNNIARFLPDVTDDEVIAAAHAAGAHELIVRLPKGYDTEIGTGGAGVVVLSAGQRQRIGLARALLREPAMIVLDEPNANLDSMGEVALLASLEAMKSRGASIVVVSHKPSMLAAADRLLVLKEGRVDLYGPRDLVLEKLNGPKAAVVAPPRAKSLEARA
ncbi:type I secretion system permease/ATPase [Brevundimonas sp. R86498]|uniref:type I secretion system permease/ATPase n=1 Tax=Brevundimonas sp. R86498 TaxID=3093845 RepID=UPI0037C99557